MTGHLDFCPDCGGEEMQTRFDGRRWCLACGWLSSVRQAGLAHFA